MHMDMLCLHDGAHSIHEFGGLLSLDCVTPEVPFLPALNWSLPSRPIGEPCLRIVWPSGLVTSFLADYDVTGSEFVMAVLPGGWLALHAWDDTRVQLLSLGPGLIPSLPPSTAGGDTAAEMGPAEAAAAAAEAGLPGLPGLEGLAADLAALLDVGVRSGCEGSSGGVGGGSAGADVTVVVGDRSFLCHRAILGARCEYFRRLFQSNFVDSCCSKVRHQRDWWGRGWLGTWTGSCKRKCKCKEAYELNISAIIFRLWK